MRRLTRDDEGKLEAYQIKAGAIYIREYRFDDEAYFELTILPDPEDQVYNTPNGRPTIEWLLSLDKAKQIVAGLSEGIDELTRET